jgi:hypothetical protein
MTTYGPCTHRPPSPGQSMCECQHTRRELEFAAAIVERSRAEAVVTIALPWEKPPLTQNQLRRMHHMVEARAKAVALVQARDAIQDAAPTPMPGANVILHWRLGNKRRLDGDGAAPTLKVCLDALVHEGILHDDSWVEVPHSGVTVHPPEPDQPAAMWLTLEEVT